ncbi:MAG TPA: pyridoxamine 5'-phosphate oxidase family protein [Noviherbaspirillum sp.]
MKPSLDTAIHLLHAVSAGTLATNSAQLQGYPFATALPFVPDERHCPVFLISRLAEHTKNVTADSRTSFLVSTPNDANVLTGARMTLVGDAVRVDATPALSARYARYQPDAEQYLGLGDFAFFRLTPKRIRHIAGFGQMGWIEESDWTDVGVLSLEEEARCLHELIGFQQPGVRLLGIDCYGCDIEHHGKRDRLRFGAMVSSPAKMIEAVKRLLAVL